MAGETVKLPSWHTWYVDYIAWGTYPAVGFNNVTLRGAGANSTFLIFSTSWRRVQQWTLARMSAC